MQAYYKASKNQYLVVPGVEKPQYPVSHGRPRCSAEALLGAGKKTCDRLKSNRVGR